METKVTTRGLKFTQGFLPKMAAAIYNNTLTVIWVSEPLGPLPPGNKPMEAEPGQPSLFQANAAPAASGTPASEASSFSLMTGVSISKTSRRVELEEISKNKKS